MDFSQEQEQHQVVYDFIDSFLAAVKNAQIDASKFDPAGLLEIMHARKSALVSSRNDITAYLTSMLSAAYGTYNI